MFWIAAITICYILVVMQYRKTEYYRITKRPHILMLLNKGHKGEYYTYKNLRKLGGSKRFLFNAYIPKDDGTTTEIDVIMLHETGIYVFESKNYSGWIFGHENHKNWTMTLPGGKGRSKKYSFYNPIRQNQAHVRWLRHYLNEDSDLPFYSFIIFSNRCELKKITLTTNNHCVIRRMFVLRKVKEQAASADRQLSEEQIETLHKTLYPLTQAGAAIRERHVQTISHDQKA